MIPGPGVATDGVTSLVRENCLKKTEHDSNLKLPHFLNGTHPGLNYRGATRDGLWLGCGPGMGHSADPEIENISLGKCGVEQKYGSVAAKLVLTGLS